MDFCRFLLIAAAWLQTGSLVLSVKHTAARRSAFGLSLDLQAYTCLWFLGALVYGVSMASANLRQQYAHRYPVFPEFAIIAAVTLADVVSFGLSVAWCFQTFWSYRKTRAPSESPSLPFCLLTALLALCLLVLLWLFSRGHATVNQLDLACFFWLLGDVSASVRLFSVISTTWFYTKYFAPHHHFLSIQLASVGLSAAALAGLSLQKVPFHQVPLNSATWEFVILNGLCLAILATQKHLYRHAKTLLPLQRPPPE